MLPNHVPRVARAVGRESGPKSQPYFQPPKHSTTGRHSQWNAFLSVLLLWPKSGRKSRPAFPSDFQASRAAHQVSTQRMANATLGMNVRCHKYERIAGVGISVRPSAEKTSALWELDQTPHTHYTDLLRKQSARAQTILYTLRPGTLHGSTTSNSSNTNRKTSAAEVSPLYQQRYSLAHSLAHSLAQSLTRSFTLAHSLARSDSRSLARSLTHSLARLLTRSLALHLASFESIAALFLCAESE